MEIKLRMMTRPSWISDLVSILVPCFASPGQRLSPNWEGGVVLPPNSPLHPTIFSGRFCVISEQKDGNCGTMQRVALDANHIGTFEGSPLQESDWGVACR